MWRKCNTKPLQKYTKLLNDEDFKNYSEYYIESGNAKDVKEMISHILNAKISAFSSKIKTDFINLLDV
uniref:hypothetical protein n=1 Tax=Flavobacterium sp. TaxID=239 RepID=UPI0040483D86